MSMNFKKWYKRKLTYIPSNITNKHKHNYSIHCYLEITNKNIHASACYYNKKEYHNVLKCDSCDSFIPLSEEGNIDGRIIKYDLDPDCNFYQDYKREIPLIKASTNMKCPVYEFDSLYDVIINNINE